METTAITVNQVVPTGVSSRAAGCHLLSKSTSEISSPFFPDLALLQHRQLAGAETACEGTGEMAPPAVSQTLCEVETVWKIVFPN